MAKPGGPWPAAAIRGRCPILGLAAGAGNAAAKHLARVACQDANSEPKRPRDAHDAAAYPIRTSPKRSKKQTTQNNPKLPHLAQTQVLGPKTWVWQMWWSFLVVLDGLTLTLMGFFRSLSPPGLPGPK